MLLEIAKENSPPKVRFPVWFSRWKELGFNVEGIGVEFDSFETFFESVFLIFRGVQVLRQELFK